VTGVTPQSPFMIVAPLAAGREESLRALLASMNTVPGTADPRRSVSSSNCTSRASCCSTTAR
jgi:hypothetical protein